MNQETKNAALHNQKLGAYWAAKALRELFHNDEWTYWNFQGREQAIACQEYAARSYAIARSILSDD